MRFKREILNRFKKYFNSGEEMYSDYAVEVEDEIFPCHRFVLSACSPFFRALFRSGGHDENRNSFCLKEISSKTFHIIYRFLYCNENTLTEDNFLDVWEAADFLQIDFITSECQKLDMETINENNCHKYFWHAKWLDKNLMAKIREYITGNFDQFKDSECVMELEGEELWSIVRNPNLNTSREEIVVETIFKWVGYKSPPESMETEAASSQLAVKSGSQRTKYLIPILSVSRLASLDDKYLTQLDQHPQIKDNNLAIDLIHKAKKYRQGHRPNYWPSLGCHRKCSSWDDVFLIPCLPNRFWILSMTRRKIVGKVISFDLPSESIVNVHNGQMYACGYTNNSMDSLTIFLLTEGHWEKIANQRIFDGHQGHEGEFQANEQVLMSFSLKNCICVVHVNSRNIYAWDSVQWTDLSHLISVPGVAPIIHATGFTSFILAICGIDDSIEFNVYNKVKQNWEKIISFKDVRPRDIVSFYWKNKLYFLTSDGELFVAETGEGGVSISHMTSIPNFSCSLMYGEVYCEDLYLFVRKSPDIPTQYSHLKSCSALVELFSDVFFIPVNESCSRPIPAYLNKEDDSLYYI